MEFKMYYTLVKNDAVIGKNKKPFNGYARGVIHGIMTACSADKKRYPIPVVDEGRVYCMVANEKQYDEFKNMVEKIYPNSCIFNYDYKK